MTIQYFICIEGLVSPLLSIVVVGVKNGFWLFIPVLNVAQVAYPSLIFNGVNNSVA